MNATTKSVSYGELLLEALNKSELNSKKSYSDYAKKAYDDYWYAPLDKRENSLIAESVSRGMQFLAKKVA